MDIFPVLAHFVSATTRTYALLSRTVYVIGNYVCQFPPCKWGSFAMSHLIWNLGRSPKPAISSMVSVLIYPVDWMSQRLRSAGNVFVRFGTSPSTWRGNEVRCWSCLCAAIYCISELLMGHDATSAGFGVTQ